MSLAAFVVQFLIVQFGPKLLVLCGVDDTQVLSFWIFKNYTLAAFISFLVANTLAKIISYILNRKKTFNAVNNLAFSMTVYVIMCVTLIIVETLIGEPLAKAYASISPETAWLQEWSPTMSMITYSIADFLIVFIMEKFIIMNDNLFKGKKNAQEDSQDEVQAEAKEVPAAQDEADAQDEIKDEKVEEEVISTPVEEAQEEPKAKAKKTSKAKTQEEVKEEAKVEEPAVEEAPIPAVEEAQEEPAKEEAKAEEEPVEGIKEEVKAAEPAKEEVKEEPKAATKKAPKATAAKKAPAKTKNAGKIEFDLRVDGYHFEVLAMNGQLMFESQGFASLETAQGGLETFRKALETGVATVYQDKRGTWRFIINKRYVGEGYKTRPQAEAAIESVKRDAIYGTIAEFVEDPEEREAFNAAKKNFNKGTGVDWDKALKVPAKTFGKFEITGRADRGFFFTLYANNGQILYCSRYYASEDSCEDAITTFKKACYLNNFFIDKDKFGNWRFVLKGTGAGIVYVGESYGAKDSAISASESVRKFAATAKIVLAEDQD